VEVLPVIKYCGTPAGRIAYPAAGSGPPLLCHAGWVSHVGSKVLTGIFIPGLSARRSMR